MPGQDSTVWILILALLILLAVGSWTGRHRVGAALILLVRYARGRGGASPRALWAVLVPSSTWFARFAEAASLAAGSAWMFCGSLVAFLLWLAWGPFVQWGDIWHLIPTSILTWTTWVLVVLIQNAQTRQETALQRKVDELIKAVDKADNRLIGLEKQPPDAGMGS